MPHILIEYTAELASEQLIETLLDELHTAISATGLFVPARIRIRATPLHHYRCGGDKRHFVHAQLRIHTGRSDTQKCALSNTVLTTLQQQRWPVDDITVEVVEMARESYAKFTRE